MTKRDRQTREYAAESYEEGDEIRTNSTTIRDTTPAVGSVHGEGTVGQMLAERVSITRELMDENESLREALRRLAEQDATLSVQGGSVTVTLDATLTDEEREAIEWCIFQQATPQRVAVTLRRLLERLT